MNPWKEKRVIGGATLYLGDCLTALSSIDSVSAVITDPPYESDAHTPMRRSRASIEAGADAVIDFAAISERERDGISAWSAKHCEGWFLAFCQAEAALPWRNAPTVAGAKYRRAMVWVKPDSSPQFNGQGPAQGYESIVTAWCGSGPSRWNGGGEARRV